MVVEKIVMSAFCAAFSRGAEGRITAWNRAAERLFDRPSPSVVGRPCHQVLAGRDEIGSYCSEKCPTWRLAAFHSTIPPYVLEVASLVRGRIKVEISILMAEEDDGLKLIHLIDPLDEPGVIASTIGDPDHLRGPQSHALGHFDATPRRLGAMNPVPSDRVASGRTGLTGCAMCATRDTPVPVLCVPQPAGSSGRSPWRVAQPTCVDRRDSRCRPVRGIGPANDRARALDGEGAS